VDKPGERKLPLAQSTVSQHLKVLKEAGIIQGEVDVQV
jgi:ArsR family transcriptional regulator